MEVTVDYHGGSDYFVESGQYKGVTLNLIEKNASGLVQVLSSANDVSTTTDSKKYAGSTTLSLDLTDVTPSDQLPNGHYYALAPVFSSSNGKPVYAQAAVGPITVTSNGGSNDVAVTGVKLTPKTASIEINETIELNHTVSPFNATDKSVYFMSDDLNIASVTDSGVVTGLEEGMTYITVTTNDGAYSSQSRITVVDNSGETDPGNGGDDPGNGGETDPCNGGETDPGNGGETDPGNGGETDPGNGGETDPGNGSETDPGNGGETDPGNGGETDPGNGGETDPGNGGTDPGNGGEGNGGETDPGNGGETPGNGGETDP